MQYSMYLLLNLIFLKVEVEFKKRESHGIAVFVLLWIKIEYVCVGIRTHQFYSIECTLKLYTELAVRAAGVFSHPNIAAWSRSRRAADRQPSAAAESSLLSSWVASKARLPAWEREQLLLNTKRISRLRAYTRTTFRWKSSHCYYYN